MKFKLLNQAEVNFEDMCAKEMVRRLLIVSTDPDEIWESFEVCQPNFFGPVLQKIYSLDEHFVERIKSGYEFEVNKIKEDQNIRIKDLKEGYKTSLDKYEK